VVNVGRRSGVGWPNGPPSPRLAPGGFYCVNTHKHPEYGFARGEPMPWSRRCWRAKAGCRERASIERTEGRMPAVSVRATRHGLTPSPREVNPSERSEVPVPFSNSRTRAEYGSPRARESPRPAGAACWRPRQGVARRVSRRGCRRPRRGRRSSRRRGRPWRRRGWPSPRRPCSRRPSRRRRGRSSCCRARSPRWWAQRRRSA